MLARRLRRRSNIKTTLRQCLVLAWYILHCKAKSSICLHVNKALHGYNRAQPFYYHLKKVTFEYDICLVTLYNLANTWPRYDRSE